MRTTLFLIAMLICLQLDAQEKPINFRFHKNVALFGYIIELGDPSDNDPEHPISVEIHRWPEDQNNILLQEIFELGADLDYGLLVSMLYQLPEFPLEDSYVIPSSLIQRYADGSEEKGKQLSLLLQKANEFARRSHFDEIWTSLAPYRSETLKTLRKRKPSAALISKMEEFYETSFSSYEIVPSLTVWSGPGWAAKNVETNTATFILGPLNKNYDFDDDRFQNLAIHEFGHSYVNHVVLPNKELLDKTKNLFDALREDMTPQGYGNWNTCMVEHFVRAGEVIVPELLGDSSLTEQLLKDYVKDRKFVYLPFIVEKLKYYRLGKSETYEVAVRKTLQDLKERYIEE